jgi:hypothetical protein
MKRGLGGIARDLSVLSASAPAEECEAQGFQQSIATIAAADAFRPLAESGCPLAT